jgi:hypothetical protein
MPRAKVAKDAKGSLFLSLLYYYLCKASFSCMILLPGEAGKVLRAFPTRPIVAHECTAIATNSPIQTFVQIRVA